MEKNIGVLDWGNNFITLGITIPDFIVQFHLIPIAISILVNIYIIIFWFENDIPIGITHSLLPIPVRNRVLIAIRVIEYMIVLFLKIPHYSIILSRAYRGHHLNSHNDKQELLHSFMFLRIIVSAETV